MKKPQKTNEMNEKAKDPRRNLYSLLCSNGEGEVTQSAYRVFKL